MPEVPALSVPVLIEDFEQLRESLGIESWTIIGHSSGGAYALDYALAHPRVIDRLILDCPALDTDATDRHRLPRAAALLDAAGMPEEAERCRELAGREQRLSAEDRSWEAMTPLGAQYLDLFFADAEGRRRYEEITDAAPDGLDWSKSWSHRPLLADMYVDRLPQLPSLTMPSMLVHGDADLVAAPAIVDAYRAATGGPVATIANAGHFSFVERPTEYVDAVMGFLRG
ncbi:alpha/beta hydrolase [Microbacterium sp. KUDC0406]|uniref:alpha/beta fold hydrolase n=1 Tax=Microbacterium sp. KUDC0406 TaxID=2909588 RepID=UPI001F1E03EC|nr:alpha/beta hydrolase [Microbacterium sp. KUDC0406]UJP11681.1 alpha/beta hydrolase [Microbacterium sp. KUDC0406]